MTESEFKHNMAGGKTLTELSGSPDSDYWAGYQRGCRRNYHGEAFGTESEHKLWLSLSSETRDDTRRFRGIGYRAGFDGLSIREAINHLHQIMAGGALGKRGGSVKSAKKSATSAANGKKGGRPKKVAAPSE